MNKLDFKNYKGFCILNNDTSYEAKKLIIFCLVNDIKLLRIDKNNKCPENYVPCGSVKWCLKSLGFNITPNYYPKWLNKYLNRNVWKEEKWPLKKVFIKPADIYKRFTGFITTGTYNKKKKPPFWCSEIINFDNEYRYYITNGKVLCGEWYTGKYLYDFNINNPEIPDISFIDIPKNFSGTIDIGIYDNKLTLVEVHHPFACGWYGKDDKIFFQWLIDGWEYVQKLKK